MSIALLRINTHQLTNVIYAPLKTGRKKRSYFMKKSFTLYFDGEIEKDYAQHDKRSTTLLFFLVNMNVTFYVINYHRKKKKSNNNTFGKKRIYLIKIIQFNIHLKQELNHKIYLRSNKH